MHDEYDGDSYDFGDEYESYEEHYDFIEHYGMPRRSGRYPWGSGKDPNQHGSGDWLTRIEGMQKSGMSEKDICDKLQLSTTEFRLYRSIARGERRSYKVATAKSLHDEGKGNSEIARIMGEKNESTIRGYLKEDAEQRMNQAVNTAKFLKEQIDKKGIVDVGIGVEREIGKNGILDPESTSVGISKIQMKKALTILEAEGYNTHMLHIPQVTDPSKKTNMVVACSKDINYAAACKALKEGKIGTINDYYSFDGGKTFEAPLKPTSIDSSRVKIKYNEEGGINKDGVIEIRPGVKDLSLGNSSYAQVRIAVDGSHYLKGMALYSDKIPEGYDVVFNTNKHVGTDKMDVLKKMGKDDDGKINEKNPFGATIIRSGQTITNGVQSAVNKIKQEGDWGEQRKTLPSQFLVKQNIPLIKRQLNLSYVDKVAEFDEIKSLNNPTIKRHFLESFANDCDTAAVTLKAAALPRQSYQVILPIDSLKDNEVYAPNYRAGEKVALVRFPHGGTFEIPILTVNNSNSEAVKTLGKTPLDCVGINSKVAGRLSGADFDGDTVLVLPTGRHKATDIVSTPELEGLAGFDPKESYATKVIGTKKDSKGNSVDIYGDPVTGKPVKIISEKEKQKQMGEVSNLITDMTLKGATTRELSQAVRHSMVVIDSEKHKLNYKQSEIDNNISYLKKKYQSHTDADGKVHESGASTLISRAKSPTRIPERAGEVHINQKEKPWYDSSREEGALLYQESGRTYEKAVVNKKTGEVSIKTVTPTTTVPLMSVTTDAHTLSSGTPKEELYADYANSMKSLANQARKEMVYTGNLHYSPSAKITYQKEVDSLNSSLNVALKNAPRERQAQILANSRAEEKYKKNPDMTKKDYKRLKQQELTYARDEVGSSSKVRKIQISDKEWAAIQAGAISDHVLTQILNNTDEDALRQRATPRTSTTLSDAKKAKIRAYKNSDYTIQEIADQMHISRSTVAMYLKGE
jgi:predicted transcriptional regulator